MALHLPDSFASSCCLVHEWFWLECPFYPEMGHIIDLGQIRNTYALPYYDDHFGSLWSILVHFGAHHGWPHHPSMTGSDSYPLSKVHLIQKWVISVTQDKFETLLFCRAILTIWINFGPIWSILVHLMGDPTTPTWLVLTPIPFQVSI